MILAGGGSSRMGRAKAMLPFGNETLLERTVSQLRPHFSEILIVAPPRGEAEPPRPRAARVVYDRIAYQGPLAGLQAALAEISNPAAFASSCDLPFIRGELAAALCAMLGDFEAVIPRVGGRLQPLTAVYRKSCGDALAAMLTRGQRRLTDVSRVLNCRIVEASELEPADPGLRSFINLNTPLDYQRALEAAGLSPSAAASAAPAGARRGPRRSA